MENHQLVGAWRMVSWTTRSSNGLVRYPFGQDASGYILYTADGYMNASIMTAQRQPFAANDLIAGTIAERSEAAATYISYSGRYQLLDDRVIHSVELSLFPNWVGTRQERFCEFAGNRLILSTNPILVGGNTQRHYLEWERVTPPAK